MFTPYSINGTSFSGKVHTPTFFRHSYVEYFDHAVICAAHEDPVTAVCGKGVCCAIVKGVVEGQDGIRRR